MKRILYTKSDGGVVVVTPTININDPEGFTEQDAIDRAMKRLPIDAIDVRVVEDATIPRDRTFRDSWENNESGPKVNMNKAKAIHMNRIRDMRNQKLDKLDKDLMRAQESDDNKTASEIKAEKNRLRNLPQTFDLTSATTPEQLKALWPAGLDKPEIYK